MTETTTATEAVAQETTAPAEPVTEEAQHEAIYKEVLAAKEEAEKQEPANNEDTVADAKPAPEAKPETKTEEKTAEKPRIAPEISILARKQRALERDRKAFEDEKRTIAQERESFKAWSEAKRTARQDPEAYLKAAGLDFAYLRQYALNNFQAPKPTPEDEVKAIRTEIEDLRKSREAERTEAQTAAERVAAAQIEATRQATINDYREQLRTFIDTAEDYPLLSVQHNAAELMLQAATYYAQKTGEALRPEDAARIVEERLSQQPRLQKRAKGNGKSPERTEPPKRSGTQNQEPMTLTNDITAEPTAKASALTDDEAREQAAEEYVRQFIKSRR